MTQQFLLHLHEATRLAQALDGKRGALSKEEIVDLGVSLVQLIAAFQGALEPLKAAFREEALQTRQGEPGPTVFSGGGGNQCTVVVPAPKARIKAGVDIEQLRAALGSDFERYFEPTTKYHPSNAFFETAGSAPPETAGVLFDTVEVYSDTPRVSFQAPRPPKG